MSSVTFNELSDQIRVPFVYAEFDASQAMQGASTMAYCVLLVGQMLSTGTATPLVPMRPMSATEGKTLFGAGSMLAGMVEAYLNANPLTEMWAIGVDDAAEGVQASGTVTLAGTVVSAAPLCLYIGGTLVRVSAATGATVDTIASSLATAINANTSLPVSATSSAGVVTLTAKHKGLCGNDIDLRVGYYDEALPGGLGVTIVPMAGGSGNPVADPVITAMGSDQYHVIAWPWTDTASLKALSDELADRWGPLLQIDGQAIVVEAGSATGVITFAEARNDKHLTVVPNEGSPTLTWVDAAATVGIVSYYGNTDPARPFNTLTVPGVLAPAKKDRWTFREKNSALYGGVSTRFVDASGNVCLQKMITTYRTTQTGAEDEAYLSLNTPLTLSYLRYDWRNYILRKYPRHKLASDADAKLFGPGQPIMTPSLAKSEAVCRCKEIWTPLGLVENFDNFKAALVAERNAKNVNRLDLLMRPDLVNQFDIMGVNIQFLL